MNATPSSPKTFRANALQTLLSMWAAIRKRFRSPGWIAAVVLTIAYAVADRLWDWTGFLVRQIKGDLGTWLIDGLAWIIRHALAPAVLLAGLLAVILIHSYRASHPAPTDARVRGGAEGERRSSPPKQAESEADEEFPELAEIANRDRQSTRGIGEDDGLGVRTLRMATSIWGFYRDVLKNRPGLSQIGGDQIASFMGRPTHVSRYDNDAIGEFQEAFAAELEAIDEEWVRVHDRYLELDPYAVTRLADIPLIADQLRREAKTIGVT